MGFRYVGCKPLLESSIVKWLNPDIPELTTSLTG